MMGYKTNPKALEVAEEKLKASDKFIKTYKSQVSKSRLISMISFCFVCVSSFNVSSTRDMAFLVHQTVMP
ncbi:MAG: hypothetical protein ACREBI_03010 [Nitrosotalea sp.]